MVPDARRNFKLFDKQMRIAVLALVISSPAARISVGWISPAYRRTGPRASEKAKVALTDRAVRGRAGRSVRARANMATPYPLLVDCLKLYDAL